MRQALKWSILCVFGLVLVLGGPGGAARAEEAPDAAPSEQVGEPIHQIKLSEAQVTNFIAAQPDLAKASEKLQDGVGEIDAAMEAELAAIAKKHGFSGLNELDDVTANVMLVMTGLDPDTGEFTEPAEALKKEMEAVKADTALPEAEKKERLEYLGEALKTIGPLKYKENVEVVKAHREAIEKALE